MCTGLYNCIFSQINWTLSDFYVRPTDCDGFTLSSRQSFNCSREAAELLKLKLKLWEVNRDSHDSLRNLYCNPRCIPRPATTSDWVTGLSLNTSHPADAGAKRFLDCIL